MSRSGVVESPLEGSKQSCHCIEHDSMPIASTGLLVHFGVERRRTV